MQTRRNAKAAKHFFEGILGKTSTQPRVIVTDGLHNYNIVSREVVPDVEHRRSKYLNNRAENSHQPTRRRERRMQRFKSPYQAQLFLFIVDVLYHYFHPKKHAIQTDDYRHQLDLRFNIWSQLAA